MGDFKRVLENVEPVKVFEYFEKLCSVPHGSGNTKIISDMIVDFAKELNLEYRQDELNNVIIWKPASKGHEGCHTLILQGHMDMVCTKEPWVEKDMTKDGLDLIVDGDWLKADGTSLGGDDCIAVAIALAILADDSLEHPALEVVITVDEEVGMDGAFGIDLSDVKGRRMLNIDSEEEGVFTVSCAGGLRADCFVPASFEAVDEDMIYTVSIDGLLGGHSGCEIEKGRGNANKLMARVLYKLAKEVEGFRLCGMTGGKFDNVICPKADAVLSVPMNLTSRTENLLKELADTLKSEYASADPGVDLTFAAYEGDDVAAYSEKDTLNILRTLFVLPQGVIEMSQDIAGLPQTSLNLGVLNTKEDGIHFSYSIRSSIGSQKMMVLDNLFAVVENAGGTVSTRGVYPGWAFNKDSQFRAQVSKVFERVLGRVPEITATHGGLECGLFIEKLPGLDCISLGPNLKDIHSCAERLNIPSVERLYNLIVEVLKEID